VFACSRALYAWAGLRFNDWPLGVYWQYLDAFLLKRKLGESLWNLHGQPPLFNLYLGTALATGHEHAVFVVTFLAAGLVAYVSVFLVMRRLGVRAPLAFALATWLATRPPSWPTRNWLFYSLPVAALLRWPRSSSIARSGRAGCGRSSSSPSWPSSVARAACITSPTSSARSRCWLSDGGTVAAP
jgi:hypothetical protein